MSHRFTLAQFEAGGLKIRGNLKSFDKGGVKRTYEPNADGSADFHEERMISKVVIEVSFVADVTLEAIEAIKDQVGLLRANNGVTYRIPRCGFAERGEIGPEGKVDITFCGDPAERG